MEWGDRIVDLRLKLRPYTTIKACAKRIGVRQETWGKWEGMVKVPHAENRKKIADLFGVSESDIWGDDSNDVNAGINQETS